MGTCSVVGCEFSSHTEGLCQKHSYRLRRHGSTDDPIVRDIEARFWSKVSRLGPDECWAWSGALHLGYGWFAIKASHPDYAHRIAYELTVGPIPNEHQLHHKCGKKTCCNPSHLLCVTLSDHWSKSKPGRMPRGDQHWTRRNKKEVAA